MIVRIVQMTFDPLKIGEFLEIFNDVCDRIRAFPGCLHLELWHASHPNNIFMTYSIWDSEESLDHYRFSELFKKTWAGTKVLFSAPPVALSLEKSWPTSS
ncbi:MAG TPA: antibiotic biosynthesis monooxygenase [Bacteroidia bacterium]|nr:antibiotic biosynthesis monooxygenase [Bacteroidia bacterium]